MGAIRVVITCCALLAVTALAAPSARALAPPPNIILVILDDVGVELLGAYNERGTEVVGPTPPEHVVTPNIDALARRGLLFRNAWASPLCMPTRAALLTGMYGFHNGSIRNAGNAYDTLPTLPERLTDGLSIPYRRRAAIGKWHLSDYTPYDDMTRTPTELGFTEYAGSGNGAGYRGYSWAVDPPRAAAELEMPSEYLTTKVMDEAVGFVASQPLEPWFLWLALKAAHAPWIEGDAPADPTSACEALGDEKTRVRCRQLEVFDEGLGALLVALEANDPGLARTTVILLGDNGSPDHGPTHPLPIPGKMNRGAKRSLYEGGVNVPLVVAGAGVAANDPNTIQETGALVHVADVFTTVLDLARVPSPGAGVDGVSFASVLAGGGSRRSCIYVDGIDFTSTPALLPANHDVAIRNGRYKLIRRAQVLGSHAFELYDLALDPGETTPLPASGGAFEALEGELSNIDANPMLSPCNPSNPTRVLCGLGPELAPLLAVLAIPWRRRWGRAA